MARIVCMEASWQFNRQQIYFTQKINERKSYYILSPKIQKKEEKKKLRRNKSPFPVYYQRWIGQRL